MAGARYADREEEMSKGLTWTTKRVKLSDLLEWDRNPVQISERDAKELAKSLSKFDHVLPYVAAAPPNGKKGLPLLDGHQRKMVEIQLNKVPASTLVDVRIPSRPLTPKEREEIVIRLRKNTGQFDFDKLANFFEVDDLLEWGFTEKELTGAGFEFGDDSKDAEPAVDRAAELLERWGVKPGDLWQIGEHRLICGDCTDAAVVARVMGGEKAGAVVTDSPYGINREGIENDDPEGLRELFDGCLRVMPITDGVIINFQSPRLFPVWLDAIRAAGYKFERALWMYKSNDETFPWRGWIMSSEIIILSSIGKPEWVDVHPYSHDCYG
jgi:hypothetical protein